MSKTVKLLALLLLAGGMLTGCNKIGIGGGGKVVFVASSESSATRTSYSGVVDSDTKIERIDWVANDRISVWSDKARNLDNEPVADYKVKTIETSGARSIGTVETVDANGLQWDNDPAGTDYVFYGRYPADVTKLDGTSMTGTIPATQTLTWDGLVGKPDMQYAFMFAKTTAKVNAESVKLEFNPKFTAFEFVIGGGSSDAVTVNLSSFTLSAPSAISGGFRVACSSGAVTATGTDAASKSIALSFANLTGGVLPVRGDAALTVTLLAVAPATMPNLTLTITGDKIGTRVLKLQDKNGQWISFTGGRKYRLTGLNLPELLNVTGENIDWDIEALLEPMVWD